MLNIYQKRSRRIFITATVLIGTLSSAVAFADADATSANSYPNRTATIVDGFSPGGSTDLLARILGDELTKITGQAVVISNKAGAGGMLAAGSVAKSKPDGYTMYLGTIGPVVVNPHLIKNMPYDPLMDLVPVVSLVDVGNVLVVRSDSSIKTFADLIRIGKLKPGGLNYGSSGIGTSVHLAGEVFQKEAGVKMTHIAYKGGAPAMTALLSGEIDLIFSSAPTAIQYVKDGRLRALGVTGNTRLSSLPDVRPIKELGLPNFRVPSWYGIFLPVGVPNEIVNKIDLLFSKVISSNVVLDKLGALGLVVNPIHHLQFKEMVTSDYKYWKDIIDSAGIKID